MRNKSLSAMQHYYASARITLVHDLYLREWQWVDAETACFAVVMSPWFSRGWTALELAKSHRVKILFKTRHDGYLLKDLDVDILDKISPSSPHHNTAKAIRKLRTASVQSLGDLLAILGPRDTSKPRDMATISGLLAGVETSGGLSQQEIYQRILRKLGTVAHGHLFHDSATMAAPGFSWCPTNILDMPIADVNSESTVLELHENGDLEGKWVAYPVDAIENKNFLWQKTHRLTIASLKAALSIKNRKKHILLTENGLADGRALLVRPMYCKEQQTNVIHCRFVGPVYLHTAHDSRSKVDNGRSVMIRISNTDRMRQLYQDAWSYVCGTVEIPVKNGTSETTTSDSADVSQILPEKDSHVMQDMDALLFLASNQAELRESLFNKRDIRVSKAEVGRRNSSMPWLDMDMYYMSDYDKDRRTLVRAFFYGSQGLIQHVKNWLEIGADETGKIMLLSLDGNSKIQIDSNPQSERKAHLASKALHQAAYVYTGKPLVTLLLDNGAQHTRNSQYRLPIHVAADRLDEDIAMALLTNRRNPANPVEVDGDSRTAMHLVVESKRKFSSYFNESDEIDQRVSTAKVLTTYMNKDALEAQNNQGEAALIQAAKRGFRKITQLLLGKGVCADAQDQKGNTALHYAAAVDIPNGILGDLLKHDRVKCQDSVTAARPTISMGRPGETPDNQSHHGFADGRPDESSDVQILSKLTDQHLGNIQNEEGETPLHVAASRRLENLRDLLDHGSDPHIKDSKLETALEIAAGHGKDEAVQKLLSWPKYKPLQVELDKALLAAVNTKTSDREPRRSIIDALLRAGARIDHLSPGGMTALHSVIQLKDYKMAEELIYAGKGGLDEKENVRQRSALLMAAGAGLPELVLLLLKEGADITSKDSAKRTALHWAAASRHATIAKSLLKKGGSSIVNQRDAQGRTALHLAASSGATKIINDLIEAEANLNAADKDTRSALILAAELGRLDAVNSLLAEGCDYTIIDNSGKSALDWAAVKGFEPIVVNLIKHSKKKQKEAEDNGKHSKKRQDDAEENKYANALTLAAMGGHSQTAMTLFDNIKDQKLQNSAVAAILFAAAKFDNMPKFLIERLVNMKPKPSANCQDDSGQTALMLAVSTKRLLCTTLFLELGANPDIQDNEKRTALMIAAGLNDVNSVQLLIRAEANPNLRDAQGYTALHYAVKGHGPIVETLLRYTIKPDSQDLNGRTPLMLAAEMGDELLTETLLAYNANPNLADRNFRTPLLQAAQNGHCSIVTLLIYGPKKQVTKLQQKRNRESRCP